MQTILALLSADGDGGTIARLMSFISVRAALALAFSFVFCVVLGPGLIRRLKNSQAIQYIHDAQGEGAKSLAGTIHGSKKGTPTMGGLLMLGALLSSVILFGDLRQPVLWLATGAAVAFGLIGFLDDYLKSVRKNSRGLIGRYKLILQTIFGLTFGAVYYYGFPHLVSYNSGDIAVSGPGFLLSPFFKDALIILGVVYIPFAVLVLTATSNSVNLTDGQDGLAAGVTISVTLCFALVTWLAARADVSQYLIIPRVIGAGELTVLLAALTGACLGFLWFNSHPAQVFMGDTGSMMLGGLLGAVALLVKQEFLLIVVGGVFVAEAVSVIMQVSYFKLTKTRIFKMAPLHHHFQLSGIPEAKITMRFWIVSALLSIAGLFTLKIR
jgi:phospho-N-acetylmuramoyl-pentapeptide-transferase